MDIEKIMYDRRMLLEKVRDSLLEKLVACELSEPSDDEPLILTAVLDTIGDSMDKEGAIGEFFFLPISSADDTVQHFSAVITLLDTIEKDSLPRLYEKMSHINYSIPCGSYCVDEDASVLCYRLTVPLSFKLDEDTLYEEINLCMANAYICADLHAEELIRLASGEVTD